VEPGFGPVDREVAAAVAAVADLLRNAGCDVEAVRIPVLEQNNYFDPAITLYGGELGRYVRRFVGDREAELHFIGKIYVSSPDPSLSDYIDAEIKTDRLKGAFAGYFEKYDVLLCPVIPFTAPLPGLKEYVINGEKVPSTHMMRATVPFNLAGLPGPLGAIQLQLRAAPDQCSAGLKMVRRSNDLPSRSAYRVGNERAQSPSQPLRAAQWVREHHDQHLFSRSNRHGFESSRRRLGRAREGRDAWCPFSTSTSSP
jgi:Asp-tRNA(Asn)/Glu-tRNA(Gln) amidotransferase A subunit family amidase